MSAKVTKEDPYHHIDRGDHVEQDLTGELSNARIAHLWVLNHSTMSPLTTFRKRIASLVIASLLIAPLLAQHTRPNLPQSAQAVTISQAQRSPLISTALSNVVDHHAPRTYWNNAVRPTFSREHGTPEVRAIKAAKWPLKMNSMGKGVTTDPGVAKVVQPQIGVEFEANWNELSTPPDNAMAISNDGIIVSANNDGILYADEQGTITYVDFWPDFFNDPNLTSNLYDPRVVYDSGADRFFMVVLHGSTSTTSKVLCCFSQTNDPSDGWWIYNLTGNPLNNGHWFDYPSIGVSTNEVYATGNLFSDGANVFGEAVIYQIPKAAGYAGQAINWAYWNGITPSPYEAFSLVPATWGQQGNYGPGILLVSSAAGGAGDVRLFDLTDDLTGTPALNDYVVPVAAYSPAADAVMPGSADQLSNGDCRMQHAFYLSNKLHCVFHGDVGNGWNGVLYKRIDVSNLSVQEASLGQSGVADLSYPSMASYSSATSDPSVMITYLRSSSNVFPEIRVANCDDAMQWSTGVQVKDGETFVDIISGDERWGDYSEMARRHNAPSPTVWLAGCYGANITGVMNNTWKTWIAEVGGLSVGVSTSEADDDGAMIYPVPALDMFHLEFTVTSPVVHRIELFDTRGSLVKVLYSDRPRLGENRLSFNRGQLAPGHYVLTVTTPSERIIHEEIILDQR